MHLTQDTSDPVNDNFNITFLDKNIKKFYGTFKGQFIMDDKPALI